MGSKRHERQPIGTLNMLSDRPFEIPGAQLSKARKFGPKRVAVAGADSELACMSARVAVEEGWIHAVLLGDEAAIRAKLQAYLDAGANQVAIQPLRPDGSPGID